MHSHAELAPASSSPLLSGVLQRQCACGGSSGPSGECESCSSKKQFSLQTKLKVNEPGDIYEREADRIANQVMTVPAPHAVSRGPLRIQRFSGQSNEQDTAPASVDQALATPGRPLEPALRHDMEQRFGHDFGKVRVHSDARAAESAQAINSLAYTVGHRLVFNRGQYRPDTVAGKHLLAHELTHVLQQESPGTGDVSQIETTETEQSRGVTSAWPGRMTRIGPAESAAEREAHSAARAVALGRVPRVTRRATAGTVQRSFLGSLGGFLGGVGFGGALGSLFGPIGTVIGGIVGGLGGLIAGSSDSADKRKLSSEERYEAERVFGPSLNYDSVRIAVSRVMSFPSHARTPYETVYFPPDIIPDPADLSDDLIAEGYFSNLIHELTHVWQTQHGIGVIRKTFAGIRGKYDYGSPKDLRKAWSQGKHFLDFGLEQQGKICADYYVRLRNHQNTSAFRPFIMELRQGGRRVAPGMVPASELGDFPEPTFEEPVA